jgi:hypothetical protein
MSLIHESSLHGMQHSPIIPCSLKEVHTANSGFLSLIGMVSLKLEINHIETTADVCVTHDVVRPMILVRDRIQKHRVNICFATKRISFHDGATSIPLVPTAPMEAFVMILSSSIVIPHFHERLIFGSVPIQYAEHALFTPNINMQHSKLILIPYAALHIRNFQGIVSIRNNTRRTTSIPRHPRLGMILTSTENLTIATHHDPSQSPTSSDELASVCSHCEQYSSLNVDPTQQLTNCCKKNTDCSHQMITELLTHIVDPTELHQVYRMIHRHHQLFEDTSWKGTSCLPQSAINSVYHYAIADSPRRTSPANRPLIAEEMTKLSDRDIIHPLH